HRTIGLFLAPFGIINLDIDDLTHPGHAHFAGFSDSGAPPLLWLTRSMFFELGTAALAKTPGELAANLQDQPPRRSIEPRPAASILSKKANGQIAETYRDVSSTAAIAANLGVAHAHLTRQFKKDFSLTPISYLHQLRVNDAVGRLYQGAEDIV